MADGLDGVAWAGDRFVAVGTSIGLSEDGDLWRRARTPVDGQLTAVAWNGQRLVAVGLDGLIMYSDDGDWWSRAAHSATAETLTDVAWNGERFVAVGHHGIIVHSSDGDLWDYLADEHLRGRRVERRAIRGGQLLRRHDHVQHGRRPLEVGQ